MEQRSLFQIIIFQSIFQKMKNFIRVPERKKFKKMFEKCCLISVKIISRQMNIMSLIKGL